MEKFLAATRVQERFTQPFTVAYDSLIGKTTATTGASAEDEAASAATKEEAAKEASEADGAGSAVNKKTASREADIANFRAQCEAHCKQELEARWLRWSGKGPVSRSRAP